MSTKVTLGDQNLLASMKEALNQQMLAAAEPLIQEALKKAEIAMRQRLAANLIGFIDSQVTMERHGRSLVITILREPEERTY